MARIRHATRATTWITWFAAWMLALAPALSHALSSVAGPAAGPWGEVCTARGMVRVAQDAGTDGAGSSWPATPATQVLHCALCAGTADAPALPAPDLGRGVSRAAVDRPAEADPGPACPGTRWPDARPRAPPTDVPA